MTRSLRAASLPALAVALLWNAAAFAQDAQTPPAPAPEPEAQSVEITVTGTRIQRDGYQAPTPLTVINAGDIEATAPANVADFVNEIPSLVGSVTPANSNLNISAGTAGGNALNLR
ncbi:MAG TPA: TonB-dependent receptor, partial [Sphingomonas sp.]|nr:TonB-dependent receptor [Sphingomonas sp.]